MSFIYGLQSAARNCFFFRFNLLTNWRKCNTQAVTSGDFHQVKINHIVNKSLGLGVNHGDRWTPLPENFLFYRTFNTKRKGPGTCWPLCEAFDELLSINVLWSQEFPGVRVWT